ncbi:MAG TPA: cytochrome c oxidase assembly protein [Polyangiaceae bacterium]|nr:cytochrome c oxidase assembly protein [Polyangiaceae bacterium]
MCIEVGQALSWWTADPVSLPAVALSSMLYGRGLSLLWRSAGVGSGIRRSEALSFYAGQVSLLIALVSPIDRLSDVLFSAHMTQHEILLVVAPPLLVLGKPLVALVWALGPKGRSALLGWLDSPGLNRLWRRVSAPVSILLIHGLVLWLWHIPSWFEAALRNEWIHALQHASFLSTAVVFWWGVTRGRYGRGGYGMASAFVFATAMHTSILGALLTVAARLWYPLYAVRGQPWSIDVIEDQRLAGLIMWVPAGLLLAVLALALFAAWLGESARRVKLAERRRAAGATRAIGTSVTLCDASTHPDLGDSRR